MHEVNGNPWGVETPSAAAGEEQFLVLQRRTELCGKADAESTECMVREAAGWSGVDWEDNE